MRKQSFMTTLLLIGLAVCLPLAPTKGQMTGASGQRPLNAVWHKLPGLLYPASDGLWVMSDRAGAFAGTAAAQAVATGGPDDFGYTWDDSVPFDWIDATSGTDTGMSGDSWWKRFGPINLPFAFKYYENTYNQVYIAASGYVAFTDEGSWPWQSRLPWPGKPNNVVAPYWAPLSLATNGPRGRVYYKSGGAPPNRYFVVEWHQVTDARRTGGQSTFTFEVVLYENGDILFQYATMNYSDGWSCGHAGIEDSAGLDGLAYGSFCQQYPSNKAVRFSRPAPSARVQVRPPFQGQFVAPGEIVAFQQLIRNTGELGSDTYDVTVMSPWPVNLFATDGTTLLSDTDGDGVVDTGPLAERSFTTVTVMIETPPEAGIGDYTTVSLKVQSSLDPRKQKTATLRAAIAAPFAQVFRDGSDVNLYLVKPAGQVLKRVTSYGSNMAVAETPDGNFVCAWHRWLGTASEIEYAVLDPYGNLTRPVSNMTDHSGATVDTYDQSPAVAVAPNGRIGVLWRRELYNRSSAQYNDNVYFAILDAAGNVVVRPTNLTNNAGWGDYWGDLNAPRFWSPRIAATTDNRFMLAWTRSHAGLVDDIYYAVRDTSGTEVRKITKLTNDTGWGDGYLSPTLTALLPDRVLIAFERADGDIYFAVLDSSGNLLRYWRNLSNDAQSRLDQRPDAVQLSDGRIVVAWTSGTRIRFAVLDQSYNRIAGPITLDNPAAVTGDDYVSVTADASGRAILTWMDADWLYELNLYYALVDGKGKVLTPPMIFRASPTFIQTNYEGYGNTSYSRYD